MIRLNEVMKEQGRSKVWLARKLGVHPQTVYKWCWGHIQVPDYRKIEISKILGVPIMKLFFDLAPEDQIDGW